MFVLLLFVVYVFGKKDQMVFYRDFEMNDTETGESLNYISEKPMEYVSMEFDKCYIYDAKENKSIKLKKSKDISGNERYVINVYNNLDCKGFRRSVLK